MAVGSPQRHAASHGLPENRADSLHKQSKRMSDLSIVVTRAIPDPGPELLRAAPARVGVLQTDEEQGVDRGEFLAAARGADVLLTLLTETVDREVLEANPNLRGVANMAVGYNNIHVDVATELGIPVTNTPGVLTDTTADFAWAMILGVARRIPQAHEYMAAGRYKIWGPGLFLGGDVSPGGSGRRKVLGVVGFGRIGQAVARRSIGFDMDVLVFDPFWEAKPGDTARSVDLETLLRESDFVTLHPPLTPETRHLISEDELRLMKGDAYLINSARGPVVDEKALVKALREGWIRGAALDVFEDEPLMADGLAELDNVAIFPHIASASSDTRGRMAQIAVENSLAHLALKRAPQCVNPEVYETEAYRQRVARLDG